MSAIEKPVLTPPVTAPAPVPATQLEHASTPPARPKWQKYATPALVLLLTAGLVVTITWNWNAWEGGRSEQITDDASVRGDLTPRSAKFKMRGSTEPLRESIRRMRRLQRQWPARKQSAPMLCARRKNASGKRFCFRPAPARRRKLSR